MIRRTATPILLALCLLACGASARQRTISTALVSVNAARDAWEVWGARHRAAIIEGATSLADGTAKLAEYRERRDKVSSLFIGAYRAIGAAAALNDDAASLGNLARVAKLLVDELRDISKGALP